MEEALCGRDPAYIRRRERAKKRRKKKIKMKEKTQLKKVRGEKLNSDRRRLKLERTAETMDIEPFIHL